MPVVELIATPVPRGAVPKTGSSTSNANDSTSGHTTTPPVITIDEDLEDTEEPGEYPLPWWATEEQDPGNAGGPTLETTPATIHPDDKPTRADWDFQPHCYNCNSPDHRRQQCPKPRIIVCYSCGRKGVTTKTCPHCGDQWRAAGPYVPALGRNVPRAKLQTRAPPSDTAADTSQTRKRTKRQKHPQAVKTSKPTASPKTLRGGPPPSPPPRPEERWAYHTPSYEARKLQGSPRQSGDSQEYEGRSQRPPVQYHAFSQERGYEYRPQHEEYPPLGGNRTWGRPHESEDWRREEPRRGRGGLPDPRYEPELRGYREPPKDYYRSTRDRDLPSRDQGRRGREEGPRYPPRDREYDPDYSLRGPEPPPPGYW
ncbi:basic salivary proline-rich protein 3-like [Diachasma alloeum]|uniref:basic salivary proline-rich protein 3-like n=1 Tax=Diachasma alloeum TaxID=454923 RepID=UPI00073812F3|nr:basic salivary proline-rich protein 3-like [Diachasma alloeum]